MFEIDDEILEMSLIEPVMLKNGFSKIDNSFTNDKCEVVVDLKEKQFNIHYRGKNNENYWLTSDNLNLYFLYGYLSAEKLIKRDFEL